jgi:hypothetical protein
MAGCRRNQPAESRNVRHRGEVIQRPALADQGNHFIDETVKAGDDPAFRDRRLFYATRKFGQMGVHDKFLSCLSAPSQ